MGFLKGFLDGIYLGFGLIFGIAWAFIKSIPWWGWIVLIIYGFLRFFVLPNRGISFHFPRRNYLRRNRGKTFIDRNGYRRFSNSGRSIHRWVAEKELGRKLEEGEVVHHINEDKLDNSPDNLEVLPDQEEHDEIHRYDNYEDDFDDDDDLY